MICKNKSFTLFVSLYKMKIRIFILLFFIVNSFSLFSQESKTDRAVFYQAISSDNLVLIENELSNIKSTSITEKEAYEGTLLMKKAKLVSNVNEKLSFFKEGKKLLEGAIKKDENNTEFRFLRLVIQENAPRFLGYYENLDEDSQFISKNASTLSADLKNAILNYVKRSKVLTLHD